MVTGAMLIIALAPAENASHHQHAPFDSARRQVAEIVAAAQQETGVEAELLGAGPDSLFSVSANKAELLIRSGSNKKVTDESCRSSTL
jgi:hypothetical protein